MAEGPIVEVTSANTDSAANKLLQEGWDLFAVVSNPHVKQTEIQLTKGIKPFDYVLVRRQNG